ncbi:hypothetical protein DVH05_028637 [Phytophthora capsici]|nr:hypothetical protein DVH05_028579 [Phytophthora capsici]KAG1696461.1 hypothetical protein DVH05_028637 [Phytophthora capsici]
MSTTAKKRYHRDDSSGEDDILKHLDVAFRREQWREQQRTYRTIKKLKKGRVHFLEPVSFDVQDRCAQELRKALGAEGLDESACCVCDRLVLVQNIVRREDTDWRFIETLQKVLGTRDESIPDKLARQYQAPPHISGLENVLVSPRGIHCYVDHNGYHNAWIGTCKDCMTSLRENRLPKFAITNGFCVGRLSKRLDDLTLPERFITQLVSMAAITRVMRGGLHRCIRSHCLAFDCTPGPPITLLPRSIDDVSSYRVVMVGEFTDKQVGKVKKMHRIRNQHVKDVFNFYKTYNPLYSSAASSAKALAAQYSDKDIVEHFVEHVQEDGNALSDSMSIELESVRGHTDTWAVSNDDESTVLERRIELLNDTLRVPADDNQFIREIVEKEGKERSFLVRRSNQFFRDMNGDLFARLFPHLFPFGRGHSGEKRRVAVSLKEAIKHYLALSSRQFAEDELFGLVAFDRFALQNMYIQSQV